MKVIEIRNNLIKVDFDYNDGLVLGRFIVLSSDNSSYVAQIINLKTDALHQHAIAKLLFTFNNEGIVDNYDGSVPQLDSNISLLNSKELLDLMPVETPIYMGHLAQQEDILKLDMSIFEHNFVIFSDHDYEKKTFISNCVNQLASMGEKSIIFDTDNIFDGFPKIRLGEDFKIPFNSDLIEYIFDYELADMGAETKAVIRDIFYAVQKYIETLEYKFLPLEKFIYVVNSQYQQNHMPELALLKNKLLKYNDLGIFASTAQELGYFSNLLDSNNALIVDLLDINPKLQNKIVEYVYNILNNNGKFIYMFLPVTDENSNKNLIRKFINHVNIFTTIFANHSYKYAAELKERAENVAFFAPQTMQHEFATYNTFLSKLNLDEYVIYGKLTQNVPFIVSSEVYEDAEETKVSMVENAEFEHNHEDEETNLNENNESFEEESIDAEDLSSEKYYEPQDESYEKSQPIENILADYDEENDIIESEEDAYTNYESEEDVPTDDVVFDNQISDEDIDITESQIDDDDYLSSEDLDFLDETISNNDEEFSDELYNQEEQEIHDYPQEEFLEEESPAVVPVYPAEGVDSEAQIEDIGFEPGDVVSHPRYGNGTVEKIIRYGNKTLCSIMFDNVGRRLLDPSISEFEKV